MSWKTHGATPRDNTQKVANAKVTKKSNMPSKSEPLIHVCFYKGSCWVGTVGTARHKASLPPPPIGGTARHGTKHGGTRRFRTPPPPMPTAPKIAPPLPAPHRPAPSSPRPTCPIPLHNAPPRIATHRRAPCRYTPPRPILLHTAPLRWGWLSPFGMPPIAWVPKTDPISHY